MKSIQKLMPLAAETPRAGKALRVALLLLPAVTPLSAHASLFAGEALDKAADFLAIFVLLFVPVALIWVFWLVHVLPEKIAEKRHHPQKTAIKTLCLLSLVFGGLLWPIAWLWAYTRPVAYRMAYGTDKHEDYFREAIEEAEKGAIAQAELEEMRHELEGLATRGQLTPELRALHERLRRLPTLTSTQQAPPQSTETVPKPPARSGGAG